MDYCSACPRLCQSACPVAMSDGNEAHTPWGLMQTLNMVRKGVIPLDSEVAALSYQCTTCRACTSQCEHLNVIPPVLHEVRKMAVERDIAPPEIAGFLAKFHRHNNPFSKDLLHKLQGILPRKYFERHSQTVYFASCTTIAKCPEVIEDTFALFEKLKMQFISVYPETIQCCGYPLITSGSEEEFVDLAEVNFHALKKYKTVICGSPTCVYTLRETYKKYDLSLGSRVVTINQFLEPIIQNINYLLKKSVRTKFMYHDPCYSSRYLHESDLPRDLVSQVSGYAPIEFFDHRETSQCSGQGGCYSIVAKEYSDAITKKRLEEAMEKKVQMILTQCPSCIHKFRKNSKHLIVKDVISYLNDCIEGVKE